MAKSSPASPANPETQNEGEDDAVVGRNAHQGHGEPVIGNGPHGHADLGLDHHEAQEKEGQDGHQDDPDLQVGDVDPGEGKDAGGDERRETATAGAQEGQVGVFQDQPAHQRRDDNVEAVDALAAKWPVGHPLQGHPDHGGKHHGQRHGQGQDQPAGHAGMRPNFPRSVMPRKRRCRPRHEDVAVGEVDQKQYAVDQTVPQGDEGIEAPPLQGVEDVLDKGLQQRPVPRVMGFASPAGPGRGVPDRKGGHD
jgi:hypothetical protein